MKRLLAFLLLLAAGIALLLLAIGDEGAVASSDPPSQPPRPSSGGLDVRQGKVGATVSQAGYLRMPSYRTIAMPDGREKKEETFVLEAQDSRAIDAGLQQLDRVEVQLFEEGRHAANLLARQAFVELGRDANGQPELKRDKDVDLRDAVFVTLPGSKMPGLRLEFGNARVRVGDLDLVINTAPDQPVHLVVDGEQKGTLRGKGLQARLPRDRNGAMQRADLEILHEPVLETAGVVVKADGRMHYVEDTQSAVAQVTLDENVRLDLQHGISMSGTGLVQATPTDGAAVVSTIRGDQFTGWLLRSKQPLADGREQSELVWRRLAITGAPATVDVASGRLRTPRITVLPGLFGEPFLVTAHGGESRIEQTALRAGSKQKELFTGVSPRRIHLMRPGDLIGPAFRSFGFPQWTLGTLNDVRIVAFEGNSRAEMGSSSLTASRGLQAFGSEGSDNTTARGFGEVRIEKRATRSGEFDLVGTGNDGFWLRSMAGTESLRLGPMADLAAIDAPWRSHRYDVQQGGMHLHGQGAFRIERTGERTQLWLRAPGAEIAGRLTQNSMELTEVRQLEATLEDKQVTALDVAGLPAQTTIVRGTETIRVAAPRLLQIGAQSLRLLMPSGPGANELWRDLAELHTRPTLQVDVAASGHTPASQISVAAPQVDVHHLGSNDVLVDAVAEGTMRPAVHAKFANKDGTAPTTASFHPAHLRMLPFALSPEAQQAFTGGGHSAFADLAFHSFGKTWLVVDDVPDFRLEDEKQGLIEGSGTRLLISEGARAAVFFGDPDLGMPAEVRRTHEGHIITTTGARVRVLREEELHLQALRTFPNRPTFLLPSVTLHEPGKLGLLSHVRAVCRGNIEVLPDAVLFHGPVTAQGLREDGGEDPDGLHIQAENLVMKRQARTGEIARVVCKDVKADWSGMTAKSAELDLDPLQSRLIARDAKDARVTLPDGRTLTAPRIEVDYNTMSFDLQHGRVEQKVAARGSQR